MARVFLMEDEPNISFVLQTVLNDEGHTVITANNGVIGLEKLSKSPKPDLLLLDLNMPGLNGREVAQRIKTSLEFRDIPIVIMSGCTSFSGDFPPTDFYEAVLTKPFDLMDMVSIVKQFTAGKTNIFPAVQQSQAVL